MLANARNSVNNESHDVFVANHMNNIVTRLTTRVDDLDSYYSLQGQDVDKMEKAACNLRVS